jgi:hypothetical protein
LFLIRRVARRSMAVLIHRTPNDLFRSQQPDHWLGDADESDDRGPRFTDPYCDALKQSTRSIEERGEDDARYMPLC